MKTLMEAAQDFIDAYRDKYRTAAGERNGNEAGDPAGFFGPLDEALRPLIAATRRDMLKMPRGPQHETLSELLDSVPDSLFKANLMVVVATHLQGAPAERRLSEIMEEFSIAQITS